MSSYVVDSSAIGPLLFADESDDLIPGFADIIEVGDCIVPQHWELEVANQLIMGLRRSRTTDELAQQSLTMLRVLPIAIDDETGLRVPEIYQIALRNGLTIYDAAYAELALRTDATIVTFDRRLRDAAVALEIPLLP